MIKKNKSKKIVPYNENNDEIIEKMNKLEISTKDNSSEDRSSKEESKKIFETEKNKIWKHIFEELKYDGKEEIIITATQIKKCGKTWKGENNQFEPRLLCKQDCDKDRPQIFVDYGIYILSVKNGEYLLTKNSIYCNLIYPNTKIIEINKNDDSLLLSLGNSESSLIDNLRYAGVFSKKQYLGEEILYGPLLNGRHRCTFNTKVGTKDIEIIGSQYETDACYESENKILIIECKTVDSLENFNIRQLYYPFRSIYDIVKDKKEIISLFINKDKKDVIHIWRFIFENPLVMTSIKNVGYNKYQFD
jgi:hypothetical protein